MVNATGAGELRSMTGFAAVQGAGTGEIAGWNWAWEMRAVNARGLDIRLRLPDWIPGLEAAVRAAVQARATRGNVTLSLRVQRDETQGGERIEQTALARVLDHLARVEAEARAADVTLAPTSAAQIITLRGVLVTETGDDVGEPLAKALIAQLPEVVEAFDAMRRAEGATLTQVITGQLDRIATLTDEAAALAEARRDETAKRLRENLAKVMDNTDGADEARVAQELALIAVKADVTEEIDRLHAHVAAARDLIGQGGAVGRKLDFLSQEFNREANTLCSKAQSAPLTRVGLDLKAVIDQMREQIQNVE